MGTYFKIVNPVKRQYLGPGDFGEDIRWQSVLCGELCIQALKYLIADVYTSRPDARNAWELEGTWVGDPVILTGDDCSPINPVGIQTATPEASVRNLYWMAAEEFDNISHLAIAMLSESWGYAKEIVAKADEDEEFFLLVGDLLMQIQPPRLTSEFAERFSQTWPKRYQELNLKHPRHKVLPTRENR